MIEPDATHRTVARRIKPIPFPVPQKVEKRFWKKVNKTETCWLWTASTTYGYGRMGINKVIAAAHRISWTVHFGEIPSHLNVLHKCDVRTCVNPAHLFLGTNGDNVRDMITKNRQNYVCGEKSHMAKLTADDVREIRRLRPTMSMTELGKLFGITRGYVCNIASRRTWRHL